jgi:hypothetical protein
MGAIVRRAFGVAPLLLLILVVSCSENPEPADTGCGGCASGEVCSEAGACVPADSECAKTCEEAGLQCGDHCGVDCGSCEAGSLCDAGQCSCQPSCVGASCGEPNGCGGSCEPCPVDQNCTDCLLRIHVVDRQFTDGRLSDVTVAVDYNPPAEAILPGIADLRLRIEGPATVARVGLAQRLVDRGKNLRVDGLTGRAWSTTSDGAVQLLVLSPNAGGTIDAGRLAVVRLTVGTPQVPAQMPVIISIVERTQTFAPKTADQVLWSGGYGTPISVWPEAPNEP